MDKLTQAREALHLTEYEIQVLLGTSIHGCTMRPDQVFSLDMAWHRLRAIGLIDRADGLAIITEKGREVVARILAALSDGEAVEPAAARDRQLSQASHGAVKALKWNTGSWVGSYYAKGLGIAYEIDTDHNCAVLAKGDGSSILKSAYNTAEQAKAAAQADYERHIRSALASPPDQSDAALRKRVMHAIFDPGATEGFKGDRDITTWQTDAVMRVLAARATEGGQNDER